MRKQIIFLLICVGALVVLSAGIYSAAKSNRHSEPTAALIQGSPSNVVFSVPIGPEGISYANTDGEETEPWGPSSLRLGPDGSFVIVDSVGNRILRFDRQGRRLQTIQVNEAVGITDVVVDDANIFVLDESATTPTVFRLSRAGELVGREALAPAVRREGLSGITKGESGELLMELQGGTATRKLTGGESYDRALRGTRFSVNLSNPIPVARKHNPATRRCHHRRR